MHSDDYPNIFQEFGRTEFAIEKLANISKIDEGYVLLGESPKMLKSEGTKVQLYSTKMDIVDNYIPQKGKPS